MNDDPCCFFLGQGRRTWSNALFDSSLLSVSESISIQDTPQLREPFMNSRLHSAYASSIAIDLEDRSLKGYSMFSSTHGMHLRNWDFLHEPSKLIIPSEFDSYSVIQLSSVEDVVASDNESSSSFKSINEIKSTNSKNSSSYSELSRSVKIAKN